MDVYYIRTNGPDDKALLNGLHWLIKQCQETGKEGIIASPQKNSLSNALKNFGLSDASIRDFLKTESIQSGQISLRLLTPKISFPKYHDGVALVVHPNERLLKTINNMPELTSVLIIPWNMNECQDWLTTKNAVPL